MSQAVKQLINSASVQENPQLAIRDALLAIAVALNELNDQNELRNELDEFRSVVKQQMEGIQNELSP